MIIVEMRFIYELYGH